MSTACHAHKHAHINTLCYIMQHISKEDRKWRMLIVQ